MWLYWVLAMSHLSHWSLTIYYFAIHPWLLELAVKPLSLQCRLRSASLAPAWTSQANRETNPCWIFMFVFMFGHEPRNRSADASRHWRRSCIGWVVWQMNWYVTLPGCKLFQPGSELLIYLKLQSEVQSHDINGMTDCVDSWSNGSDGWIIYHFDIHVWTMMNLSLELHSQVPSVEGTDSAQLSIRKAMQ